LHNLQKKSTDHTTPETEKTMHRKPKSNHQDNVAHDVASLRAKKIRGTAFDKEISFSNDNEQLNKIPVIVTVFTAHSDTLEVPTVEQFDTKENDSDTVIINNNVNNRGKYSDQNTLPSVKIDSDSDSDSEHCRWSLWVTSH
jgi:hypothetical protein